MRGTSKCSSRFSPTFTSSSTGTPSPPLAAGAELVILAGDLAPVHTRRVGDIARRWAGAEHILYVPGNHEYYGCDIEAGRRELARQCVEHDITLLDRSAVKRNEIPVRARMKRLQ